MRNFLMKCLDLDGNSSRKRESRKIDKELHKEKRRQRRQVKILLLGAGESGKSTFLKQIRIIEGDRFSEKAVQEFAATIRQNVVMGMKVLVDAREKLAVPWREPGSGGRALRVMSADPEMAARQAGYFQSLVPTLQVLWQDEAALRVTFERRREFQLGDSVKYFLDQLPRIGRSVSPEIISRHNHDLVF